MGSCLVRGGIFAPPRASAQHSPPHSTTTKSVQVNVVNVLATVRDKHGKIVNDLDKQDFTLTEDGKPQNVRYFTRDTDLPLSLGLLVDTSLRSTAGSRQGTLLHSFLDQMVREDKDKAFIVYDRYVELLQDFTPSHAKLEAALEQLSAPQFTPTSGGNSPDTDPDSRRGRRGYGGGTHLYDAVYLATDDSDGLMSKQQGRKALIVLSDGVDRGSKKSLEDAIASAQRADTIVYSILFKDDEGFGNRRGFGGPRIGLGGGMGGPMGGGGMGRRGGCYPSEQEHP